MNLRAVALDPLNDGWNDPSADGSWYDCPEVSLHCGDTVLYRADGQKAPAILVEPAGGGCWLARGVRFTRKLIYLAPESIVLRLPRNDLRHEAA